MALTYEKYQKLQALLQDPSKDFSQEAREKAQAAVDGYQNEYSSRAQGVQKVATPLAGNPLATPDAGAGEAPIMSVGSQSASRSVPSAAQPAPNPEEARVQGIIRQLDPSLSLPAQVLATQPATGHPEGDEAAKDEWVRGDLKNPNGLVVVYDAPVAIARKELLENPEIFHALQLSVPTTPEGVMSIKAGDSTHQAYNDYKWRQTAEAAVKGGKTPYRYSRAPWMTSGKNASLLDTLSTKLNFSQPGGEQGHAFTMGVDDTANFGVSNAVNDAGLKPDPNEGVNEKYGVKDTRKPVAGGTLSPTSNTEIVGGIENSAKQSGASPAETSDMFKEEYPNTHAAGQALGVGWGLSNGLWSWILDGAGAAKTAIGGLASGAGRGAAAAGADQSIREGVQAGSSYVATGDPGTTVGESAGRIGEAALAGSVPVAIGSGVRGLGNQLTEAVDWGKRYGAAPGRVREHGIETEIGKGHVSPPVVREAELRGRKEGGRSPLTVIASDLDQPLGDVARGNVAKAEQAEAATVSAHRATPEAGYTLPARNVVTTAIERLRMLTSQVAKKGLKDVGKPNSAGEVRGIFNSNIEGVSTRATQNGIEISATEARSFLSPEWQEKLDLEKLDKKGASVWVTPRRYTSEKADEAIKLITGQDEHVSALREAFKKDRAARGTGDYGAARAKHDVEVGAAKDASTRIGADRTRGVRKTVTSAGKSKGQHQAIPALRDAARQAGGKAPEQMRGALVAEDLGDIDNFARLGRQNPLSGPWNLWGMGDKAVLKGAYPAARKLEKLKPGAAAATGRAAAAATRHVTDDRADERRKERDKKTAEGYRERAKAAGAGQLTRTRKKPPVIVRHRRGESQETE